MPEPSRPTRPLRVVVGGGIAGLTAARELASDPAYDVLLLEGSPDLGGKLRSASVAGVTVDVGAESMLHRRPEGVVLAREVGADLVHPTSAPSRLWIGDALRPLPRSLMGVPLDLDALAASGVLSDAGLARVRSEPSRSAAALAGDVSVGDLVAERLGDEVVDRLVEPLLGGVYAGHARRLSAYATTPQVVALLERGSLLEGGAAFPVSDAPVFAGIRGGMGLLPGLVLASRPFDVRTGATVRELRKTPAGFELVVGATTDPEVIRADQVVLATPPAATARLLAGVAPSAAADLATVETASVVVVTLAIPVADAGVLEGSSGFLVPPGEGRRIKASTFSFAKWDWTRAAGAAAGVVHLRTSLGRHGEERALQATDEELVAWSLADLAEATGLATTPVDRLVQRWGGGLPQYAVGHLDLVARVRAEVARVPGLAVCGATYDGVGIPAVIGSARRAAATLLAAEWGP